MKLASRFILISSLVAIFLFGYTNCGDVNIGNFGTTAEPPGAYVSELVFTDLPSPRDVESQPRLVILLDMSGSMIQKACPQDIGQPEAFSVYDYPPKGLRPEDCDYEAGVDPEGDRLKLAKRLIESNIDVPHLKVYLAPFTGANWRSSVVTDPDQPIASGFYQFIPVTEALAKIEALVAMHEENLNDARTGQLTVFNRMTTSNPGPALMDIYDDVYSEMRALESAGVQHNSHFEFIFLSDGVPAPTADHIIQTVEILKVLRGLECYNCNTAEYILGYQSEPTCYGGAYRASACKGQLSGFAMLCASIPSFEAHFWCQPNHLMTFAREWGDFQSNSPPLILAYISALKGLASYVGGGMIDLNFFPLRPSRITAEERSLSKNWLLNAIDKFPYENTFTIEDTLPQTVLFDSYPGRESFEVSDSLLINLNARVDADGLLKIDSDGDGLFDDEESPSEVSTARSNGRCLDGITKRFGCPVNCRQDVDSDGDSLNQCEEMAISANEFDFDSEADGLPDLIEALFEINPKSYDIYQDDNSDGIKNFQNIQQGLHPRVGPSGVSDDKKVFFRVTQREDRKVAFQVENLPLVQTRGAVASAQMKPSRNSASFLPSEHAFTVDALAAGEQNLIYLLGLRGQVSGQKKWFMKKIKVPFQGDRPTVGGQDLVDFYSKDPL